MTGVDDGGLNFRPNRFRVGFENDITPVSNLRDYVAVSNSTTGQVPTLAYVLASGRTISYVFSGDINYGGGAVLKDGNYQVTLLAGAVTDANGNPSATQQFDFFVLNGDANRDRKVDDADLAILRSNLGRTNVGHAKGDFNFDKIVDAKDEALWREHAGNTLPEPNGGDGGGGGGGGGGGDGGGGDDGTNTNGPKVTGVYTDGLNFRPNRVKAGFESVDSFDKAKLDAATIKNLTTGTTPNLAYSQGSGRVLSFVFNGDVDYGGGAVLKDGNYRVTLPAGVATTGGLASPQQSFDFFFLLGDANRDRVVNDADLAILRSNLGRTNVGHSKGDFNFDKVVDAKDEALWQARKGNTLPEPGNDGGGDGGGGGGGGETKPAAPTEVALSAASDTGRFSDDRITADRTPTFTGKAAAGLAVELLANGTVVGSGTTGSDGRFSVTPASDVIAAGEERNVSFTVRTVANGVRSVDSGAVQVLLDAKAPQFNTVDTSGLDRLPHRVKVGFDADIFAEGDLGSVVTRNLTSGAIANTAYALVSGRTVNLVYRGETAYANGKTGLGDGNYRATFAEGLLVDVAGNKSKAMTADFFVLQGDANRDRRVDTADLAIMQANFGRTNTGHSKGDFNYDGVVDAKDESVWNLQNGRVLPTPGN